MNSETERFIGKATRKAAISASIILPTLGIGIAGADSGQITAESRVFGITDPNFIDPHPELTHKKIIPGISVDTDTNPIHAQVVSPNHGDTVTSGSKVIFKTGDRDDGIKNVVTTLDETEIEETCIGTVQFTDTLPGAQASTTYGDLDCEANMPEDIGSGNHTLKIETQNPKGEQITVSVQFNTK